MSDPILSRMFNLMYPIGSVYISVNSNNPAKLFGGQWTQIKDRFLLACGNTYSNRFYRRRSKSSATRK